MLYSIAVVLIVLWLRSCTFSAQKYSLCGRKNDLPAHHRHDDVRTRDLLVRHGKNILRQHGKIREFAALERTGPAVKKGRVRGTPRIGIDGLLDADALGRQEYFAGRHGACLSGSIEGSPGNCGKITRAPDRACRRLGDTGEGIGR